MARYINVEIDNARLRIAEMEDNGRKSRMLTAFGVATPQGVIDDGEIRDTRYILLLLLPVLPAGVSRSRRSKRIRSRYFWKKM